MVTAGEVVHDSLGGRAFGPESAVDLVFAEAKFAELPRTVPTGSGRRGYVFVECTTPSCVLTFDLLVHADLYPGQAPRLDSYDTVGEGVASPNAPERDADRLDLAEQVEELGQGLDRVRARDGRGEVRAPGSQLPRRIESAGVSAPNPSTAPPGSKTKP
ncbi:hypothetical protein [Engelhardtia mirabilis]|uniref:Uncharacterized protein n=1 Tax=Engelhardtia mirabilis TaxID=2528011 RepID=A0A518BG25_9BACT|nr:hypothetical protein Pla133_09960 [Planctomycetes bacterium Pla133]QDV00256.1 hypothetical protein Pla86_09950 [Planctomycetes bacterium Pla86]